MTHEQLREALRIPSAWYRPVVQPGTPHGPAEYDVEMIWGDDQPEGDGWKPLYREALDLAEVDGTQNLHKKQVDDPSYLHIRVSAAEREGVDKFCRRLQQRCVDWGAYWRASDDHGVTLTSEQAIDLLRDVLGVDIEIKSATPPAAEREEAGADEEETYKIGYRDGYNEAVQGIDVLTGGDGEYRYCTDHDPDRHTPDAAAMKRRIEERFDALQAAQPAQQDEARWRNEMDALMVAMQRASEALFAATRDGQKIETAVQYEQLAVALYTPNAAIDKQRGAGGA